MKNKPVTFICEVCGKEFIRHVCHKRKHTFCSPNCYYTWMKTLKREQCNHWKGGFIDQDGYIFEKQSDGSYRGVHRIAMETALGRSLNENEIIHHIDGDKTNNDISNLTIMTRAEHCMVHRPVEKRTK